MELRRDEGFSRVPYKDTKGILTIGIGHNMQAQPLPNGWKWPLTDEQITMLFQGDVKEDALDALDKHLPWWSSMSDVRQRVIANMCFNMGVEELLDFHNTLAAMQEGRYGDAADGMKASLWYGQVGARAVRLVDMMRFNKVIA